MSGKEMSTKQRIIMESLKLFSKWGFDAVSLAEIADAVGVTKPALYKHFNSKQDIIGEILKMSDEGFAKRMEMLEMNFDKHPERTAEYAQLTEEDVENHLVGLFLHTAFDKLPRLFRQILTIEQFHLPSLAKKYNQRYIDCQFAEYESLFKVLMEAGKIKKADPHVLAVSFMSVVILMVEVCDREPRKKEDAVATIRAHIREFFRIYRA